MAENREVEKLPDHTVKTASARNFKAGAAVWTGRAMVRMLFDADGHEIARYQATPSTRPGQPYSATVTL